nr:hypothetical protein [Desulfurococcales archaeon]
AFGLMKHYLESLRIGCELRRIELGPNTIREARDALSRAMSLAGRDSIVEVYTTGGPRLLTMVLTVVSILDAQKHEGDLRIVAYGEGFEGGLEIDPKVAMKLLRLDEVSEKIVERLSASPLRINELQAFLRLPRSTLYKKLGDLRRAGIVVREKKGLWKLHSDVEKLI